MVRVGTADTNPDGGGGMLAVGWFHFQVLECFAETKNSSDERVKAGEPATYQQIQMKATVLNGNPPDQVGRKKVEFFSLSGKAAGRFLKFACATGLITKEQWEKARDGGGLELDINEADAVGRTFVGEIKMEEKDHTDKQTGKKSKKSFPELGFRFYSPLDPEVESVPKDATAMSYLTPAQAGHANGNGATAGVAAGAASDFG